MPLCNTRVASIVFVMFVLLNPFSTVFWHPLIVFLSLFFLHLYCLSVCPFYTVFWRPLVVFLFPFFSICIVCLSVLRLLITQFGIFKLFLR